MISIFKTSIGSAQELSRIAPILNSVSMGPWTVDLHDCDKILRVDSGTDQNEEIVSVLTGEGFLCVNLATFYTEPQF